MVIRASTEAEAIKVMEAMLRAFAKSPDILDRWGTPQEYKSQDGTIVVGANDLGFNGPPNVGEVRERFGITPG